MWRRLLERWPRLRGPETTRHERGRRAEALARAWLAREGFILEAANVRVPGGELDLVAREGTTLCFIEVRSCSSLAYGGPLASVTWRKQRCLIRAARWYLARRAAQPEAVRFDVVSVTWDGGGRPEVELLRGAFDAGEETGRRRAGRAVGRW